MEEEEVSEVCCIEVWELRQLVPGIEALVEEAWVCIEEGSEEGCRAAEVQVGEHCKQA